MSFFLRIKWWGLSERSEREIVHWYCPDSRSQVSKCQSGTLSSANEEAASNAVTPDFSRTGTMIEAYRNLRSCAILIYPYFLRTTYLYQDALSILSRDSSVDWSLDSNTSSRTEAETLTKIMYWWLRSGANDVLGPFQTLVRTYSHYYCCKHFPWILVLIVWSVLNQWYHGLQP